MLVDQVRGAEVHLASICILIQASRRRLRWRSGGSRRCSCGRQQQGPVLPGHGPADRPGGPGPGFAGRPGRPRPCGRSSTGLAAVSASKAAVIGPPTRPGPPPSTRLTKGCEQQGLSPRVDGAPGLVSEPPSTGRRPSARPAYATAGPPPGPLASWRLTAAGPLGHRSQHAGAASAQLPHPSTRRPSRSGRVRGRKAWISGQRGRLTSGVACSVCCARGEQRRVAACMCAAMAFRRAPGSPRRWRIDGDVVA